MSRELIDALGMVRDRSAAVDEAIRAITERGERVDVGLLMRLREQEANAWREADDAWSALEK